MSSNILRVLGRIFEQYGEGKRMEMFGPNYRAEEEDRQLRNQFLISGNKRSELSSALQTLTSMDALRERTRDRDIETAGVLGREGMSDYDEEVRALSERREDDRQRKVRLEEANIDRASGDPEIDINDAEYLALKRAGLDIGGPGKYSPSVITTARELEERRMTERGLSSRASARPGGRGTWSRLTDDQGRIHGYFNPATKEFVESPLPGGRGSGMAAGELDRRGMLNLMFDSVADLKALAAKNKGSIGFFQGRIAGVQRETTGVSSEVNDLFHIADNLSDVLLRARSGAQINEQEYNRLRRLVPNPRGPEGKFFDDLRRFEEELLSISEVRDIDPETGRMLGMGTGSGPGAGTGTGAGIGGRVLKYNPATGKVE